MPIRVPLAPSSPFAQALRQEEQIQAVNDQAAFEQDFIAKQQREQIAIQRQQESAAADAARQQKATIANAKRAGVQTRVDPNSGQEDIQRHEDGQPVYQAGFIGQPQVTEKGGAAQFRDARGGSYKVSFDAIREEKDPSGETFYNFDLAGPDGTKQTMRQPAGTKPLFRTDPTTGNRLADMTDPATGSVRTQVVGIDPMTASNAAIAKRRDALQLRQNEISGAAEQLRLEQAAADTKFRPVAERFSAAEKAYEDITKAKTRFEERMGADGKMAVHQIEDTSFGEQALPLVDAPSIAKARAWMDQKKRVTTEYEAAKAERDPAKTALQAMQEKRDQLALEHLSEKRRAEKEIRLMGEAAKKNYPVYEPEWQKRFLSILEDPRVQDNATIAELEDAGDPMAEDVKRVSRPASATALNAALEAGIVSPDSPLAMYRTTTTQGMTEDAPRAKLVDTVLSGITAGKPATVTDAKAAKELAAKSLGMQPEGVEVSGQKPEGHYELTRNGEMFATLDPRNNRLTLLDTPASLQDKGAEIIANASPDGVPVYMVSSQQPFRPGEVRDLIQEGIAAVSATKSDAEAKSALAAVGLDSAGIRQKVMDGKLSVQDGKLLNDKFNDVKQVNTTAPAVQAEFGKYLTETPIMAAKFRNGTREDKAAVVNQFMDGFAAKASNGVVLDRSALAQRRDELLAATDDRGSIAKGAAYTGGAIKNGIASLAGIGYWMLRAPDRAVRLIGGTDDEGTNLVWNQSRDLVQRLAGENAPWNKDSSPMGGTLGEVQAWADRADSVDSLPDELADKLAEQAFTNYHGFSAESAADVDTTRDTFNIKKNPQLRGMLERYLKTGNSADFNGMFGMLKSNARERETGIALQQYIERPRTATPADAAARAELLGIKLDATKATAALNLAGQLENAKDEKQYAALLKQAAAVLGLENPVHAELALSEIARQETTDPDSWTGSFRGASVAGIEEAGTEIVSDAALAALSSTLVGAPEAVALKGAQVAAKQGIRGALKRFVTHNLDTISNRSSKFAAIRSTIGRGRAALGRDLTQMGDDFQALGMKKPTFGQPLTTGQKASNLLVGTAKATVAGAPLEAMEEGLTAILSNDPSAANIGESMLQGALGVGGITPVFAGVQGIRNAFAAKGQIKQWEKVKGDYIAKINEQMGKTPGFKPLATADFDAWQGLQDNPAQAQAAASYREALSTFEQELALHQEAAAGNSSLPLTPELLAARVQLDGAAKDLELATSSAFMAMDELRGIPEAERPLYTAAAKAATGARDFTEAEAKALMAQSGNNAVVFQQAQVMPADVAGPPSRRAVDAPAVSTVAPGVYRLPEGVRVDVPPALLDSLVQRAPTMVDLLRQPANQTPAVQAVVAKTDAAKQASPKAPKEKKPKTAKTNEPNNQTPVQAQQGGGQIMPGPGQVPVVPGQPPAQTPTPGATAGVTPTPTGQTTGQAGEGAVAPAAVPKPTLPAKAIEKVTREAIGRIAAKSPRIKALLKESKKAHRYPTGGMWLEPDGKVSFHIPTIVQQLQSIGVTDNATAGKRVEALLDEEIRHSANMEAARRLFAGEQAAGRVLRGMSFETWRDAWYGDIWNSHFTDAMRQAVQEAYGDTLPEADWMRAMEGLRMLDQLRATGSITEAVLLALDAILESLREFLDLVTAGGKKVVEAEIMAIREVLAEYGYEGGTVKPDAKKKPTKPKAQKPEAAATIGVGSIVRSDAYRSEGDIRIDSEQQPANKDHLSPWYRASTTGGRKFELEQRFITEVVPPSQAIPPATTQTADVQDQTEAQGQRQTQEVLTPASPETAPAQGAVDGLPSRVLLDTGITVDVVAPWNDQNGNALGYEVQFANGSKRRVRFSEVRQSLSQTPSNVAEFLNRAAEVSNYIESLQAATSDDAMTKIAAGDALDRALDAAREGKGRAAIEIELAIASSALLRQWPAAAELVDGLIDLVNGQSASVFPADGGVTEANPETAPKTRKMMGISVNERPTMQTEIDGVRFELFEGVTQSVTVVTDIDTGRPLPSGGVTLHPSIDRGVAAYNTLVAKALKQSQPVAQPAKPAEPSREAWQKTYAKFKRALAKAVKAKDYAEIIRQADAFQKHYEADGNGPFPDTWSDWERHKSDAEMQLARQGSATNPLVVPILKPVTPPRPAERADDAYANAQAATRAALGGLFSAPVRRAIPQLEVPRERFDAIRTAAEAILEANIRTPEAFARFMDDTFPGGKARPYSEAIWDMLGIVDKSLRGSHDWTRIYGDIEQPLPDVQEPVEASQKPDFSYSTSALPQIQSLYPYPWKGFASTNEGGRLAVDAGGQTQEEAKANALSLLVEKFNARKTELVKENNNSAAESDTIRDLILSNDSRAKKAQAMKKLAEERGETLKQTQEFIESRLVQITDEVARNGNAPAEQFSELVDIYEKQPLFSARTSTSMENQAYSTPAPMAFALRHMTGVTPQTSVYDATAGNGMLAIGSDLKNSVANEIDETRLEGLRRLGIGTITTKDATDPTGAFQNRPKAQTVHLNPPFGGIPNVNFDGYGIRKLEHIISLQALKEGMADNGTAAIILGDTMNNQEQVKGAQWVFENYLYAHYNVVDNFSVSGDLYGNQGAKWPVRILVIAGKKAVPTRNQDLAPKTVDRLDTWPDVWARAERTRNEVERQRQTLGTDGQTTAPSGNPAGNAGTANTRPIPDSQRPGASTSSGSGGRGGNTGGQPRPGTTGAGGSGLAAPGTTEQPADAGTSGQPATGGRKPAASMGGRGGRRPSSATNDASGSSQAGGGTDPSGQNPANAGSVTPRQERRKAEATATQVPYDPASSGMPFETLVPRGIGESLQTALAEIVANRGPIDQYVADQLDMSVADLHKAMAAEQIDGVAMAIYQMETGGALIIGDETGIGKGRQAASLIRFAILKGKIPVFFTKDPKLFSDMWGDLKDIGTTVTGPNASASDMSVRPLVLGDSEKAQIKTPDNVVVLKPASNARQSTVFAAARENGFASTGHNAIFATYSQIRDPNARQEFLEWLAANDDVVVVLDEAHESAGDGETSMQAAFMMGGTVKRGKGSNKTEITKSGLLNGPGAMHPRGGVAYLSATFAKRPDNMPVYFRTDLRKGSDKFSQVVDAMDKGGVALQQAITEALAEAGQYTRRERDFTGVSYAMKQVTVRDEAELVRQVDAVTNVLSSIANFSKLIRAAVADSTARSDSQSSMTDFASIVHNQVSQLLLAAKADAVVDEVVEAHKRGEKPIVALMNTMESFLSQYVEDMNIKPGQPMRLNWADLLEYALSRTLRASEKQPNGDTVIYTVDPAEHGLGMAYQRVLSAARAVNVGFPVSPIDYIIQKSRAGGVEVGELTGRESGIDYTNFQTGEGTYRKFKRADKNTLVNTFNNGSLAGMLLNASGSTGLSIHAASKFKDQKPRHMIIAQPALDINVFIQTLGRIKRTGIVLLGRYPDGSAYGARYSHLTLPLNSELRPAIMAARKMKSLNANTTGESDSAVKIEAEDLMNRFGNQVVAEYLSRNPELQDALNIEVEEKEDGTVVAPKDIARKFTGRMALQPNKVQGEAYAEIISDYRRAIEQAKVTGDYDLEIIVHEDWDATRGASEQIVAGTDESSIFTSSVNVEMWDMTDNRPTPSGADMLTEFTKENGSREQLDARWQDFSRQVDERLDSLEQRLRQRLAEASGQLAGMSPDDPAFKGLEREVASLERNLSGVNVKKARWRDTQRRLDDIVDEAGRPVTLENAETQEMDHGMMTQIKFPDISGQLRIAPSAFKMTYLLNRPGGRIYPTLAQFKQDGYTQARSQYSLEDMTGDRGGRRERRTILVGSPIRAYGATGGKGKVVRFKARDGSLVTGILMPRSWNISNLAEDPRKELADAGAVEKYIRDLGWTPGFVESGESVRIHASNGTFRITSPSARRTGGEIFLDNELREIVGDFIRNGQRMTARIDSISDVPRVAARVMQLTGKRFKGQDVARVRKANGVDENADMDSPARTAKPKSVVKAAATEAWNRYLDEGGTAANPSVNQISRDQWLNRIDDEEGRSLRSAPAPTMPRDRAEAIVANLTPKEQAGKLNPREREAIDEARMSLASAPAPGSSAAMASDSGAAQNAEPSPGGLSEADAKTPMTIYRAGDADEVGVKPFSSWTPDKQTAIEYQDNPGFGGEALRQLRVDAGNVLAADTTSRRGMRDLAEALGFESETGNDWFDNGWRYPWEESSKVKRALEDSDFDAVQYTDDFPAGATTIIFTREPQPIVKPSFESSRAAGGTLASATFQAQLDIQQDSPSGLFTYDARPDSSLAADERDALRVLRSDYPGERLTAVKITGLQYSPDGPRSADSRNAALADWTGAFGALFGKRVLFFDGPGDLNGAVAQGQRNVILLNANAPDPLLYIIGHELTHSLRAQQPDLYKSLEAEILATGKDLDSYRERLLALGYDEGSLSEEMVADFMGSQFLEPDFLNRLAADNPTLFDRFARAVLRFIDSLLTKAGMLTRDIRPHFQGNIQALRDKFADALKAYAEAKEFPANPLGDTEGTSLSASPSRQMLEQAAATLRGEGPPLAPGLRSMFNPSARRPTTGERGLFDRPKDQLADSIAKAYRAVQMGQSTVMVPIRAVFQRLKAANPALKIEDYLAAIQAADERGDVMLEAANTTAEQQANAPFVVPSQSGPGVRMAWVDNRPPQVLASAPSSSPQTPTQKAIYEIRQKLESADAGRSEYPIPPKRLRAQAKSLLQWAAAAERIIDRAELERATTRHAGLGGGEEHDVWHDASRDRVIKLTKPKGYGIQQDLTRYLDTIEYSNRVFGDDIVIEGVVFKDGWPHILISQPFYRGSMAPQPDIDGYFADRGAQSTGRQASYLMPDGARVYDAKPRNVLRLTNGEVQPIDVQVALASAPARSVTAAQDAEYMSAVEAGDMATARRLVDEAAKAAGYDVGPVYHGTKADFTSFDSSKHKGLADAFYHFGSEDAATTRIKGKGKILRVYLQAKNPIRLEDPGYWVGENLSESLAKSGIYLAPEDADEVSAEKAIRRAGHDSIIYRNDTEGGGDSYAVFSSRQIKSADPVTRDAEGNVIPLSQRFNPQSDSILFSAPSRNPNKDTQAMRDVIEGLPDPHRKVLRDILVNGMSVEDAATTHTLSEAAVINILRRGEAHVRVMMDARAASPELVVEDGIVKAAYGRPDLAGSGNSVMAAVDQRRMTPEEVTHAEMQESARRMFDVSPEDAGKLVSRWLDSSGTDLRTDGMNPGIQAIIDDAQARLAVLPLMMAASQLYSTRKTIDGTGNSTQLVRLAWAYRDLGTEAARALSQRRDPFDSPAERNAYYLQDSLLTPPESMRNELRRNPANRERILAAWAKRADQIKAEMLAEGIDLDATFREFAKEQQMAGETIPEPVKPVLARAPKKTRQLIKALMEGLKPAEAIAAAGLTAKAAFAAYKAFRETVNQAGQAAAQGMQDQMLRSAPAADFAANLGLPDLTEAEWLEMVKTDKPLRQTPETEKLKQQRERKKAGGELDLRNPKSVRKAQRKFSERKSTAFDKMSEFWRASILSGPQTHVVNIVSGLTYGTYEATFKKLATGAQADIARMFGMKPDAASLADIPAMLAAAFQSVKQAGLDFITEWQSESNVFDSYAMALNDSNGQSFKESYGPALAGKLGTVMRGISFRLMGAADAFVKSFFTRIEVVAQARQIARNEGLEGEPMRLRIAELTSTTGSEAWERALAQAKRITFQNEEVRGENGTIKLNSPLMAGSRAIDEIDKLALLIARTKKGDFGKVLKGLTHFTFPFVDTPTNIFKAGVTMSPIGGLLAIVDAMRSLHRRKQGNTQEAERIYNATRALDDLANQIVAWGFILGLSELIKPGDDDEELPYITGTIPWRTTSPGEREIAYRTAPPQSIRIGGQWYSYKRLDPFASALAFTVDAIREMQSGKPMDEAWGNIGLGMLRNMQDKTFLQGVSDLVNAVQDPERFGTKWATNIAIGFVPNLIRQPIRTGDDVFRENDMPNDMGFWESLGRRVGFGVYPKGWQGGVLPDNPIAPMPAFDVWGREASKNTGTGQPGTDWLLRLFSPVDMRDADNVDPLDRALLRYNYTHDEPFGVAAPSREIQRTLAGKIVKVSLNDAEYTDFVRRAGQAARAMLGNTFNGRDLNEQDIKNIKSVIEKTHDTYRDAAFVSAVQARGGINALADTRK